MLTRRAFGGVAAAAVAGIAVDQLWPSHGTPPAGAAPVRPPSLDGLRPYSMAMHQHSSFSEQSGSMAGALNQAAQHGVDVVWWTDHNERMDARRYRTVVHFSSLDDEQGDGPPWTWTPQTTGPLASSDGGVVAAPASPKDTVAAGSLHVSCRSRSTEPARNGFFAESHSAGWNYHCNAYGQQWSLEVLPQSTGPDAYLELLLSTSSRPATAGRPAGVYQLSYRFGGPGAPGTRQAAGLLGIVNVPVRAGEWNSVTIRPSDDLAALWPDLQTKDFATSGFQLAAVSTGGLASGYFDYLRFARPYATGDVPLGFQRELRDVYAAAYPSVAQRQGLEISPALPHLNWFGGKVTLPAMSTGDIHSNSPSYEEWLQTVVGQVHAAGGLASYNHPYGAGGGPLLPARQQDDQVAQTAAHLLRNGVLGCDILEVGYVSRNGVDLDHHVALWDALSANGRFLTGNGVTDDHFGMEWLHIKNNWTTTVWAAGNGEADLLRSLTAGRAYASSLSGFHGTLDMVVDGRVPMGAVSTSALRSRRLSIRTTGLSPDSTVEVVRGAVDYAGTRTTTSTTARIPAASLHTGPADLTVDTSSSCFVRLQVRNGAGAVVALSNPVWLLRDRPRHGVPTARAA